MYLYMCDIYTQLGYLFKAETSIATIKKNNKENTTKQTFSKTFPLFFNIYQLCKLHKTHHVTDTSESQSFLEDQHSGRAPCEGVPARLPGSE